MRLRRRKPYTEIGISRIPCTRCGSPSRYQWRACADDGWRALCPACDVALNEMALRFMRVPGWRAMIRKYRRFVFGR